VSHLHKFHSDPAEIDEVLAVAQEDATADTEYQAVMEATGMS
jgi:hypothetical protein